MVNFKGIERIVLAFGVTSFPVSPFPRVIALERIPSSQQRTIEEPSIFDFGRPSPTNTWYHYAGTLSQPYAIDATNASALLDANITLNLTGNNIPYFTNATYYGTGFDTFEPTIGVTS